VLFFLDHFSSLHLYPIFVSFFFRIFFFFFQIKYIRTKYPNLPYLAVDGGINILTGKLSALAGANVLIAGTAIFGKNRCRERGSDKGTYEDMDAFVFRNFKNLLETLLANGV
jgi:hypothetical protein